MCPNVCQCTAVSALLKLATAGSLVLDFAFSKKYFLAPIIGNSEIGRRADFVKYVFSIMYLESLEDILVSCCKAS